MRYAKFCRIAFIVAFALIAPCTVAAQDFSTVPDFPSDFTLIDPKSATPSPSPAATTATTSAPKTVAVADTPTGPASLAVVTLATLFGLIVLGIIRWHSLTAIDHDHQN